MKNFINKIVIKLMVLYHSFLRKYSKISGHLTEYEGLTLYNFTKKLKSNSNIVEVGSFHGKSANYICAAIKQNDKKLYCVDIWKKTNVPGSLENDEEIFANNTIQFNHLITRFKGDSKNFKQKFLENIDLLFIDADHTFEAVKEDLTNLLPLVKKGSFILFHDYGRPCGVKIAVDEAINNKLLKKIKVKHSICICIKI